MKKLTGFRFGVEFNSVIGAYGSVYYKRKKDIAQSIMMIYWSRGQYANLQKQDLTGSPKNPRKFKYRRLLFSNIK